LAEVVTHQVVARRPSNMVDRLMSSSSTNFLHRLRFSLNVYTRVHQVLFQTDIKVGRPATP
jgi:hypothetical protein